MFQENSNDFVIPEITNDDTKGDSPRSPCRIVAESNNARNSKSFMSFTSLDEYSKKLDPNNRLAQKYAAIEKKTTTNVLQSQPLNSRDLNNDAYSNLMQDYIKQLKSGEDHNGNQGTNGADLRCRSSEDKTFYRTGPISIDSKVEFNKTHEENMIANITSVEKKIKQKIEVRQLANETQVLQSRVFDLDGAQQGYPDAANSVIDISRNFFSEEDLLTKLQEIQSPSVEKEEEVKEVEENLKIESIQTPTVQVPDYKFKPTNYCKKALDMLSQDMRNPYSPQWQGLSNQRSRDGGPFKNLNYANRQKQNQEFEESPMTALKKQVLNERKGEMSKSNSPSPAKKIRKQKDDKVLEVTTRYTRGDKENSPSKNQLSQKLCAKLQKIKEQRSENKHNNQEQIKIQSDLQSNFVKLDVKSPENIFSPETAIMHTVDARVQSHPNDQNKGDLANHGYKELIEATVGTENISSSEVTPLLQLNQVPVNDPPQPASGSLNQSISSSHHNQVEQAHISMQGNQVKNFILNIIRNMKVEDELGQMSKTHQARKHMQPKCTSGSMDMAQPSVVRSSSVPDKSVGLNSCSSNAMMSNQETIENENEVNQNDIVNVQTKEEHDMPQFQNLEETLNILQAIENFVKQTTVKPQDAGQVDNLEPEGQQEVEWKQQYIQDDGGKSQKKRHEIVVETIEPQLAVPQPLTEIVTFTPQKMKAKEIIKNHVTMSKIPLSNAKKDKEKSRRKTKSIDSLVKQQAPNNEAEKLIKNVQQTNFYTKKVLQEENDMLKQKLGRAENTLKSQKKSMEDYQSTRQLLSKVKSFDNISQHIKMVLQQNKTYASKIAELETRPSLLEERVKEMGEQIEKEREQFYDHIQQMQEKHDLQKETYDKKIEEIQNSVEVKEEERLKKYEDEYNSLNQKLENLHHIHIMKEQESQKKISEIQFNFELERNDKDTQIQDQLKEEIEKNTELSIQMEQISGELENAIENKNKIEQAQDYNRHQFAEQLQEQRVQKSKAQQELKEAWNKNEALENKFQSQNQELQESIKEIGALHQQLSPLRKKAHISQQDEALCQKLNQEIESLSFIIKDQQKEIDNLKNAKAMKKAISQPDKPNSREQGAQTYGKVLGEIETLQAEDRKKAKIIKDQIRLIKDQEEKYIVLKKSMKKQMNDTNRLIEQQNMLIKQIETKKGDKDVVTTQNKASAMSKLQEKHYFSLQQKESHIQQLEKQLHDINYGSTRPEGNDKLNDRSNSTNTYKNQRIEKIYAQNLSSQSPISGQKIINLNQSVELPENRPKSCMTAKNYISTKDKKKSKPRVEIKEPQILNINTSVTNTKTLHCLSVNLPQMKEVNTYQESLDIETAELRDKDLKSIEVESMNYLSNKLRKSTTPVHNQDNSHQISQDIASLFEKAKGNLEQRYTSAHSNKLNNIKTEHTTSNVSVICNPAAFNQQSSNTTPVQLTQQAKPPTNPQQPFASQTSKHLQKPSQTTLQTHAKRASIDATRTSTGLLVTSPSPQYITPTMSNRPTNFEIVRRSVPITQQYGSLLQQQNQHPQQQYDPQSAVSRESMNSGLQKQNEAKVKQAVEVTLQKYIDKIDHKQTDTRTPKNANFYQQENNHYVEQKVPTNEAKQRAEQLQQYLVSREFGKYSSVTKNEYCPNPISGQKGDPVAHTVHRSREPSQTRVMQDYTQTHLPAHTQETKNDQYKRRNTSKSATRIQQQLEQQPQYLSMFGCQMREKSKERDMRERSNNSRVNHTAHVSHSQFEPPVVKNYGNMNTKK